MEEIKNKQKRGKVCVEGCNFFIRAIPSCLTRPFFISFFLGGVNTRMNAFVRNSSFFMSFASSRSLYSFFFFFSVSTNFFPHLRTPLEKPNEKKKRRRSLSKVAFVVLTPLISVSKLNQIFAMKCKLILH